MMKLHFPTLILNLLVEDKLNKKMPPKFLPLYPLLSLLVVLLSSNTWLVEAFKQSETYLNKDLCRYAGAGSTKIFHNQDIDFCKCHLNKETFSCEASKVEQSSRIPNVVGTFEADLSLGSAKLSNFLYLFASTKNCNDQEDTSITCCLLSRNVQDVKPALQLGLVTSLTKDVEHEYSSFPKADEFSSSLTTYFPKEGSDLIPPHCFKDFSIKIDAPTVFKGIRHVLGIDEREFMLSIGNAENPLKDLGKLGGSGNGFYLTHDDKYFIKTTHHDEYENFMRILPNYFRYIRENPNSLLSRFSSLFDYKSSNFEAHYFITNNLLPSNLVDPQKFDLKGSTVHRKTSDKDKRTKKSVTLKDLDFLELYSDGFFINSEYYSELMGLLHTDVQFLMNQNCLDYSLLIAVVDATEEMMKAVNRKNLNMIPAKTSHGENKLLYMGIIDILQPFSNLKKIESSLKSMIHDKSSITIIRPESYAERFEKFIATRVLKPE